MIEGEHTLANAFSIWTGLPSIIRPKRPLRARVAVVDSVGLENWSRWESWECMSRARYRVFHFPFARRVHHSRSICRIAGGYTIRCRNGLIAAM